MSKRSLIIKIFAAVCGLAIVGLIAAFTYYKQLVRPVGGTDKITVVEILPGSGSADIAKLLKDNQLIRSESAFLWYLRLNHSANLKAGTYRLSNDMSVATITEILQDGKVASDLFTIFPAQRIDQIRSAFLEAGFRQDLVDTALDPKLYASHPVFAGMDLPANLEGFLYPESFFRSSDVTPQTIVRQALDETAKVLTTDLKAGFSKQGLSLYQAIILGSIIESEAHNADDRAQIAQVFYSRIKLDMPLQTDPTVFYAQALAGDTSKNLNTSIDSAYNTYKYRGLPPTPISNISVASLRAVANPADGDYLFFVAGDDGTTHFSRTIEEHQSLTRKYCTKLCK